RRRHTRSKRDWSSDVCSSDLYASGDCCQYQGWFVSNQNAHPAFLRVPDDWCMDIDWHIKQLISELTRSRSGLSRIHDVSVFTARGDMHHCGLHLFVDDWPLDFA